MYISKVPSTVNWIFETLIFAKRIRARNPPSANNVFSMLQWSSFVNRHLAIQIRSVCRFLEYRVHDAQGISTRQLRIKRLLITEYSDRVNIELQYYVMAFESIDSPSIQYSTIGFLIFFTLLQIVAEKSNDRRIYYRLNVSKDILTQYKFWIL